MSETPRIKAALEAAQEMNHAWRIQHATAMDEAARKFREAMGD